MKRIKRKSIAYFSGLLLSLLILALWISGWGPYLWMQGKGQFLVLYRAQPIEEWAQQAQTTDRQRAQVNLIASIKQFAQDSLGLAPGSSYEKIYDQKGKPVLWALSACERFALEPYTWNYPLIGEAGYRGFFEKDKGKMEMKALQEMGYDVSLDPVSAWSTLGWFSDPILSNMLDHSEGELARLIIHEMTHGTIFVESDAVFNENLATFIGDSGAYCFLAHHFGTNSEEYRYYEKRMMDRQAFGQLVHSFAKQLNEHYRITQQLEATRKQVLKDSLIFDFQMQLSRYPFQQPKRFERLWSDSVEINNTYFTDFLMYNNQQDSIRGLFLDNFKGDFRVWLDALKKKHT